MRLTLENLTLILIGSLQFIVFPSYADTAIQKNITRIDAYLKESVTYGLSGAVLIAQGDKILLNNGYGYADKIEKRLNSSKTIFSIGSVTKQFTASAILKLVEQKKLKVSDPLRKYFPEIPRDKQDITIHQLLTHSSGFLDFIGNDDFDHIPTNDFFSELFATKLLFEGGTRHQYSNSGYSILARIIELASELEYENFVYKHLLQPAGMNNTGYLLPKWQQKNLAKGYAANVIDMGSMAKRYLDDGKIAWPLKGNGGFNSTQEDMFRWYLALRNNTVLSKELTQTLIKPYIKEFEDGDSYYAYGWAIFKTKRNTKLVTHNGSNGIFYHDFMWLTDEDIVVIYSTNALTPEIDGIARQIKRMLFDDTYQPRKRKVDLMTNLVGFTLDHKGNNDNLTASLAHKFSKQIRDSYYVNDAGLMLLNYGYTEKAIALLTLNTKLFPDDGNLWDSLGEAYYENENFDLSLKSFKKALELNSNTNCHWCDNSKKKIESINKKIQ